MEPLKVGDAVDYCSVIGGPVTSSGHVIEAIEKQPNNYGTAVAWVSGKSGCVALSALRRPEKSTSAWVPPPASQAKAVAANQED